MGTSTTADRNLLFGVLALQLDFIDQAQLISAMHHWIADKQRSLGEVLVEANALTVQRQALLDTLVKEHVRQHENDPQKSLDAVAPSALLVAELNRLADSDVNRSVSQLSAGTPIDSFATVDHLAVVGDRFRLLRFHAAGGLGEVFVARDDELHREVALKRMKPDRADSPEDQYRFLLEAEITGRLEHPGVVPVYSLGRSEDGAPHYAMRFVRGESLKEAIGRARSTGQSPAELRKLLAGFIDVCYAIEYAHSRGVVHRDLKPGNVMLGPYGETLVVDWGLAKVVGRDEEKFVGNEETLRPSTTDGLATEAGRVLGTLAYMSPEQAAGRLEQVGPHSDIYSLGATLYTILTGNPSIDVSGSKDPTGEALGRIRRGDFPRPGEVNAGVPGALEAVCLKAMALQPKDRYDSARELAEDLQNWLADEPVSAWREPWTIRFGRWLRHHQSWVTGGATATAVTLLGLAVGVGLLAAANQREKALHALAVKERDRAKRNFQLGRDAVKKCQDVLDVLESDPSPSALMELRQSVFEAVRDFNVDFRRSNDNYAADTELVNDVGTTHLNLGALYDNFGRMQEAESEYRAAIKVYERLVAEHPKQVDYLGILAGCYGNMGNLLSDDLSRHEEAVPFYDKSIEIWQRLVKELPSDANAQFQLARTQSNIGVYYRQIGRQADAESLQRNAIKVGKELLDKEPDNDDYRRHLAKAYNNLGALLKQQERFTEAETAYASSIEHNEQSYRNTKQLPAHVSMGISYYNMGFTLRDRGDWAESLPWFTKAIDVIQPMYEAAPNHPRVKAELKTAYLGRAGALSQLRRFAESAPDWSRVIELEDEPPRKNELGIERCNDLVRSGDHQTAAKEAQQIAAGDLLPANRGRVNFKAGMILATSAQSAAKDPDLEELDRKQLAERYAAKAVEHLDQAQRNKFFTDPEEFERLMSDADFNVLRTRQDFTRLIERILNECAGPSS